ncbi:hypothetical protein MTR_8g089930 [Medicago truncatula]|uniref:Uncharacterized protein n=1 Tax=Medicago truncatula TaxID=3880 RepID=A0A072TTM1_MEDTR|nr:hypothetical protein MTR_8g089930 [Medicago truncatula]
MIFIHANREITSFNTTKNVKDEFANKLTASKLIAYNSIMPTKIYDKIKVTGISIAFGSATLTPKSLIELLIFQYESNERRTTKENQTMPHKTTNNKPPHLDDEISKKKT